MTQQAIQEVGPVPDLDTPDADLKIKRLTLIDIGPFGPEPFVIEADCAPAVIISGQNRIGKTTILKTFAALHHEHNEGLIREGCEKGKIVWEYSDGSQIEHTIKHGGSDRVIRTADGRVIRSGTASIIKEMGAGWAINPLMLVEEKDKTKRKKFLLNVLPLVFSRSEIYDALGGEQKRLALPAEFDLAGFDQFIDGIREQRKDQKKAVQNQEAVLAENERTIPARDDTDWFAEAKRLSDLLADERAVLDSAATHRRSQNVIDHNALQAQMDKAIAEVNAEAQRKIALVRQAADETSKEYELSKAADLTAIASLHQPEIDSLIALKAEAETQAKNQQQLEGVRKMIEQTRARIREESVKAATLDKQVKNLDTLRNDKLASLPIKDIEIRDTQILYKGLDFDEQLSTSEQVEVSMRVCALAAGRLPVMILDKVESLDGIRYDDIVEKAKRNGFQVFMTRVVPGQEDIRVEKEAA